MKNFKQFNENWDGITRNTLTEATQLPGAKAKGWYSPPSRSGVHTLFLAIPGMKENGREVNGVVIVSHVTQKSPNNPKSPCTFDVNVRIDDIESSDIFSFEKKGSANSLADAVKQAEKLIQTGADKLVKEMGTTPIKRPGIVGLTAKQLNGIKNWKTMKNVTSRY